MSDEDPSDYQTSMGGAGGGSSHTVNLISNTMTSPEPEKKKKSKSKDPQKLNKEEEEAELDEIVKGENLDKAYALYGDDLDLDEFEDPSKDYFYYTDPKKNIWKANQKTWEIGKYLGKYSYDEKKKKLTIKLPQDPTESLEK